MRIILISMVMSMVEVICSKNFFDAFLKREKFLSKWTDKLLIAVLVFGLAVISALELQNLLVKSVCVILTIYGVMRHIYKEKGIQTLFLSMGYYGIAMAIDFLAVIILSCFLPRYYESIINATLEGLLIGLLCKTVLFLIVSLFRRIWSHEDHLSSISKSDWMGLLYLPFLTIIIIVSLLVSYDNAPNNENAILFFIVAFGIVLMNFVVFYIIRNIIAKEEELLALRLLQERAKSQMDGYYKLKQSYESQRKYTHDYIHHLRYMGGLLARGKSEETKGYVKTLTGKLLGGLDEICTNNIVADVVINQKYKYSKSKGIKWSITLADLSQVLIKEEDLVIVLSNLLDNAIEACEKTEGEKVITLKMSDGEGQLLLYVKNPTNETLEVIDNRPVTTKKDKIEHGYGMVNVSEIVNKYNGEIAFDCDGPWFCLTALIPY